MDFLQEYPKAGGVLTKCGDRTEASVWKQLLELLHENLPVDVRERVWGVLYSRSAILSTAILVPCLVRHVSSLLFHRRGYSRWFTHCLSCLFHSFKMLQDRNSIRSYTVDTLEDGNHKKMGTTSILVTYSRRRTTFGGTNNKSGQLYEDRDNMAEYYLCCRCR